MMLCNPNEPLTGSTGVVQLYSDYEQRLADAISHNDSKQINQLVADDFEMRPANDIGIPTPRADWISQSLKESPVSISIGQMAVHDYGNIRIVSFLMKRTKPGSPERGFAVVDVWMLSGENSILKVRYAALQGSASVRAPGEVRQRLRKKY
jgi:hypothetical protein